MGRGREWLGGAIVGGSLACTPLPEEVMDPTVGRDDDAASDDAQIPASCGNGMVDPGEECDDADTDPLDGCLVDCRYGPSGFVTGTPFATPLVGNARGGSAVVDSCRPGELLVALRGQVGAGGWLTRLQGSCGRPHLVPRDDGGYLVEVLDGEDLSVHGSGDGPDGFARCPVHQVVVGFGGRAGSFVDQLYLRCAPVFVFEDEVGWQLSLGDASDTESFGGAGGGPVGPTSCGEQTFVSTGLHLRVGADIDAFALECAPLVLQVGP